MNLTNRTERHRLGAQALAQLAHLLMIISVAPPSEKLSPILVRELEKYLFKGVLAAEQLTANEESSPSETKVMTSVVARQLHIALDEKNYEGFLQAFDALLESSNINPADLHKEIDNLKQMATGIYKVAGTENKDRSLTGVINVA